MRVFSFVSTNVNISTLREKKTTRKEREEREEKLKLSVCVRMCEGY